MAEQEFNWPPTDPAIVITGEQIASMTPERRAQVAEGLSILLGATAQVIEPASSIAAGFELPPKFVTNPAEAAEEPEEPGQAVQELTDPVVSPFSIFLGVQGTQDWYDSVTSLMERIPGTFDRRNALTRALNILRLRAMYGRDKDIPGVLTYYMPQDKKVLGITFEDPQRIISNKAFLVDTVDNLGGATADAFVQLMKNSGVASSGTKPTALGRD
jgi:hypothetical protein